MDSSEFLCVSPRHAHAHALTGCGQFRRNVSEAADKRGACVKRFRNGSGSASALWCVRPSPGLWCVAVLHLASLLVRPRQSTRLCSVLVQPSVTAIFFLVGLTGWLAGEGAGAGRSVPDRFHVFRGQCTCKSAWAAWRRLPQLLTRPPPGAGRGLARVVPTTASMEHARSRNTASNTQHAKRNGASDASSVVMAAASRQIGRILLL